MCQFIETIKVKNKKFFNLPYHQKRFDKARRDFFRISQPSDALYNIQLPNNIDNGLYKCRVIYSDAIKKIEFIKYTAPIINSLKIVRCDDIDYSYKYTNRKKLNQLKEGRGECDDILIVKDVEVTDISFGNIVFYDGIHYVTPKNPLLKGTMRAKLLDNKQIIEKVISVNDIWSFQKVFIINALLSLDDNVCIAVENIKK